MKINFPLSDIELNIDDDLLEKAEQLEQKQAFKALSEVEKGLWTSRFDESEEGITETEVQLSGSRVRNYTCECEVFRQYNICHHIALTLIALRRRRQREADARQERQQMIQKMKETESPSRLTIPNILKKIDTSELMEFVSDYARSDKQFAIALKTRFAGSLNAENDLSHYKTLIDNTLKSVKNPKGKITPKGWLQVLTMVDELRQKSESHFKKGILQVSFDLIKMTLPIVHRFLRSTDSPKIKMEKRQIYMMEILRGVSELGISPELKENIWEFIRQEYNQNARYVFSDRLYDWLLKNGDTPTRYEQFSTDIDHQIDSFSQNLEVKDRLLTQKIQLLQKNGRTEEASRLILSSSQNPEVLFFAIENALEGGDFVLAKSLSINGLEIFKNTTSTLYQIEEFLFSIAEKSSDTEGVLFYGQKLLVRTLDMSYWEKLKSLYMGVSRVREIVESIENQPYRIEKRDALAAIYFSENEIDKLIEFIKNLQSLELLRRYGVEIWQADAEKGVELHTHIINEFLFSHLGRPPAQRIRGILEGHLAKNAKELVDKIKQNLLENFAERPSITEEMEAMDADIEKKNMLLVGGF